MQTTFNLSKQLCSSYIDGSLSYLDTLVGFGFQMASFHLSSGDSGLILGNLIGVFSSTTDAGKLLR